MDTAKIIKILYLKDLNETLIIYEYINGKTIHNFLKENEDNIQLLGNKMGVELSKPYKGNYNRRLLKKEKMFFKGLFNGLFQNNIPDIFVEEMKFTFTYEFILHNNRFQNYIQEIERIFKVFYNILKITNNLEKNLI